MVDPPIHSSSAVMSQVLEGTVASAGAKVLATGGYLVLERPYTGIVLSLDAQLHSSVFALSASDAVTASGAYPIRVFTPQRCTAPLAIALTLNAENPSGIVLSGDIAANSFVATTLQHTLSALLELLGRPAFTAVLAGGLAIHVRGDRSFYSSQPTAAGEPVPLSVDAAGVATYATDVDDPTEYTTKTGLGSSAAVVCSLVAALFAHFGLDVSSDAAGHRMLAYRYASTPAYTTHSFSFLLPTPPTVVHASSASLSSLYSNTVLPSLPTAPHRARSAPASTSQLLFLVPTCIRASPPL
jgi:phosphomevalonate kinase